MKSSKDLFAELDEIGFIGVPGHTLNSDDRAFFALKAKEARRQYRDAPSRSDIAAYRKGAVNKSAVLVAS